MIRYTQDDVAEHVRAARAYSRYALALVRHQQPERAPFWRDMAKDSMRDARVCRDAVIQQEARGHGN